jgi:hypothetical protein
VIDPLLVSFVLKEKYLMVIGHGKRDNLTSMAKASSQIYEKVLETKSRYLLVDYRNLQINVHLSEAFNIVKRYEAIQPHLKNLVIAAVFEGKGHEFGRYWKEVGRQRGFFIEAFDDIHVAEQWLLEQVTKRNGDADSAYKIGG